MKKLLLSLLVLLPVLSYSQDDSITYKNEIGLNIGASVLLPKYTSFSPGPMIGFTYLHNVNKYQWGVTIEAGGNSNLSYIHLIPAVIANRKFEKGKSYWYVGATAGAFIGHNTMFGEGHTGILAGIQGGYVKHINRRLSFTSQVGVRALYAWYDAASLGIITELLPQIPVTVGLKYRF